mmetsp:Transcript_39136/g.76966  ORF Transcript_39136/g.76966 Transcript_39136/m.76966 type:complete len:318 (+) Transcript_39136:560-1513(+)
MLTESVEGYAEATRRNHRSAWIGSTVTYAQTSTPQRKNNSLIEHHHGGVRFLSSSRECLAAGYLDLCRKRTLKEETRAKLEREKAEREKREEAKGDLGMGESVDAAPVRVEGASGYRELTLDTRETAKLPTFLSEEVTCFVVSKQATKGVGVVLEKLGIPVPRFTSQKYQNFKEMAVVWKEVTRTARGGRGGGQTSAAAAAATVMAAETTADAIVGEKEVRPADFDRDGDDLSDNDGCEHDLAEEMRGVEGKDDLKVDEEINLDEIQRLLEEHLRETNAVDQFTEEGKLQDSDAEVNVSGQTEQREANLEVVTDFLM